MQPLWNEAGGIGTGEVNILMRVLMMMLMVMMKVNVRDDENYIS
jgi:hypothetical protein